MSPKHPPSAPPPSPREERLAKALRENLARRKALARAKRERGSADAATPEVDNDTPADHGDTGE